MEGGFEMKNYFFRNIEKKIGGKDKFPSKVSNFTNGIQKRTGGFAVDFVGGESG